MKITYKSHFLLKSVLGTNLANRRIEFAVPFVLSFFLVFGLVAAENKVSDSKPKEIRKAIPIAKPPRESAVRRTGSEAASVSRQAVPATGISINRSVVEGTERSQSTGGESLASKSEAVPNTMHALNDKRRIGIRDKLSLTIVEDEQPQRQIFVTDSGEVDVPYIGRVSVENRTCRQLAMHLKGLLEKEYYYQATVLIGLDSAGGQVMSKGKYYLEGQVNRTGQYEIPVDEVLTVSKAIIRAGGFTQYANRKKVRIIRRNPVKQGNEIFFADMIEVMEKGEARTDMEILPDDRIFVDEKFFNF